MFHPDKPFLSDSHLPMSSRLPAAAAAAENGFSYPRRCDLIAGRAQKHMVYAAAGGLAICLAWAGLTSLDKVTRGSGRIVPQTKNQMVQHLEGGILRYFEEVGGAGYEGACFVFDERIALDARLKPLRDAPVAESTRSEA